MSWPGYTLHDLVKMAGHRPILTPWTAELSRHRRTTVVDEKKTEDKKAADKKADAGNAERVADRETVGDRMAEVQRMSEQLDWQPTNARGRVAADLGTVVASVRQRTNNVQVDITGDDFSASVVMWPDATVEQSKAFAIMFGGGFANIVDAFRDSDDD